MVMHALKSVQRAPSSTLTLFLSPSNMYYFTSMAEMNSIQKGTKKQKSYCHNACDVSQHDFFVKMIDLTIIQVI